MLEIRFLRHVKSSLGIPNITELLDQNHHRLNMSPHQSDNLLEI